MDVDVLCSNVNTVGARLVDECVFRKGWCSNHDVELLCSSVKRKFRTKCRDGLYRTTCRVVKTWRCPVFNSERFTEPLESTTGGTVICQSRDLEKTFTFNTGEQTAKRDRFGQPLTKSTLLRTQV